MNTRTNIPNYVRRILNRSTFAIESNHFRNDYDPSYTIIVPKHSIYAKAETLKAEIEKLVDWANRRVYGAEAPAGWKNCQPVVVRELPKETHYCKQYAVIDIYDPIMLKVEYLIGAKKISLN